MRIKRLRLLLIRNRIALLKKGNYPFKKSVLFSFGVDAGTL
jgi:hypothetical protein